MYKVIYLANGQPLTDGCIAIGSDGKEFTYDEATHSIWKDSLKSAELFIVKSEFNVNTLVGKPSPDSLKWLKPGMELKAVGCNLWWYDSKHKVYPDDKPADQVSWRGDAEGMRYVVRVICEVCGHQH